MRSLLPTRLAAPLVLAALVCVGVVACGGPFVMFPGGALSGDPAPVPASWEGASEYSFCELETNPAEPYSVNIVCTIVGDVLYVNAGDTETEWVKNMDADPAVRVRLEDVLYELRAERVTDAEEIATFGKAWTARSSFSRDPAELDPVYVYRLVAR